MERQQKYYRTVLETANLGAEDNIPSERLPSWAVPLEEQTGSPDEDIFSSPLGQHVSSHADSMNYFQFCRILENLLPENSDGLRQVVRFRRKASLLFPSGEISSIETAVNGRLPSVRTTFLGLYGVDSILPDYFLNDIATHKDGSNSLAEFLDIFNHRVSELFYAAWKKYRYPIQFSYGGKDKLSLSLLHLIGQNIQSELGGKALLQHTLLDSKILGLLGVFHQKTRTADGICSLVKYLNLGSEVKVTEFQPQWVHLDQQKKLGKQGIKLDRGSAVLGRRIKDYSHLIHIDITPNNFAEVIQMLPGGEGNQKLLQLLKIYLGHRTDADIYLNIKKQWTPQACLNGRQMLGINTGLGKSTRDRRIKVGHYTNNQSI